MKASIKVIYEGKPFKGFRDTVFVKVIYVVTIGDLYEKTFEVIIPLEVER